MGCRKLRVYGGFRVDTLIFGLLAFAGMPLIGRAQVTASITGIVVEDATGAVSPSAGLITMTTTFPRQIQLGLKLIF